MNFFSLAKARAIDAIYSASCDPFVPFAESARQ